MLQNWLIALQKETVLVLLFLIFGLWLAGYCFAVWRVWSLFRAQRSHFNFYITDLYAVIVGLLPTFISVQMIILYVEPPLPVSIFVVGTIFLSQLLGMFYGRIDSQKESNEVMPGRWKQAFLIVNSGLIGFAANLLVLLTLGILFVAPCLSFLILPMILIPFVSNRLNLKK